MNRNIVLFIFLRLTGFVIWILIKVLIGVLVLDDHVNFAKVLMGVLVLHDHVNVRGDGSM